MLPARLHFVQFVACPGYLPFPWWHSQPRHQAAIRQGNQISYLLAILPLCHVFTPTHLMPTCFCFVQKQSDVSTGLLILGVLCQSMPLMLRYAVSTGEHAVTSENAGLVLSRACSIVMILAYAAYLYFQLKTHRQLFEPQEVTYTPSIPN